MGFTSLPGDKKNLISCHWFKHGATEIITYPCKLYISELFIFVGIFWGGVFLVNCASPAEETALTLVPFRLIWPRFIFGRGREREREHFFLVVWK